MSRILSGMPRKEFESVNWIRKPDWEEFKEDIETIAFDMLSG